MTLKRRRFLQALGIGGASVMLPSLGWRRGVEADPDCPTRILFFTTQHGAPRQHWKMDLAGLPAAADGAADLAPLAAGDFSHVLEPLYDQRTRFSVVEGLSMLSAMLDDPGNNHGVSWAHLLTNQYADYNDPIHTGGGIHPFATSMSIDQHIAAEVTTGGMIPSIEMGYGGRFGSGPIGYATAPDGSWLPFEDEPSRAFDRLFPMGPPSSEPRPPTRRELIAQQRPSVLDASATLYDRVIPNLATADRAKLEAHRDQIRALELRLASAGTTPVTCDPTFDSMGERIDQFSRLAAIALSCNLTRVVSINAGQLQPGDFGAPPGDVHQDYAHGDTPEAHMHMANYYRYHAEQFAALLGHLDAVPEGSGTLLDNTMVIWMTELATGGHDMTDALTVVAGGGGGALTPGRYVRFAANRPSPCSSYGCQRGADVGMGHSHLFVSAMQAMGMPDDSFGISSGTALDGSTIDLSGPLPLI